MKNGKKLLAWMLLATLPTACAVAEDATLERAAKPLETAKYERYPSAQTDAASGKWTLHGVRADALLDRFWAYDAANGDEVCAFHLEVEGSEHTGVWTPVLRLYYANGKALNATAVSILVDGVRYDLAAHSEEVEGGRAQRVSAPLTKDAEALVRAMQGAEEFSVRLIGDHSFTVKLDRSASGTRRRLEAASLETLDEDWSLLKDVGIDEYGLWDLSADAWKSEYGYAPALFVSDVETTLRGVKTQDDFGMVERGDQTQAVRAAQEILMESGFLSGTVSSSFTKNAVAAARRAQEYLGLIVTGCVDAQLEQALKAGASEEDAPTTEMIALGDVAEVALERYWFADGVSASNAPTSARTVSNGDNCYLVADGWIRNISAEALQMFMQMQAKLVCNETYVYEAALACECSGGTELDTQLLPLAKTRLLVYAEIPASLAQEDVRFSLVLSAGDAALEFELQ